MVLFKLGRSPAGGLVQICTYDPRNVQNSLVDDLNIEASTGLHHSHKLVSNETSILDNGLNSTPRNENTPTQDKQHTLPKLTLAKQLLTQQTTLHPGTQHKTNSTLDPRSH